MTELILTQYSGKILGPIAKLLGWLMNGIYIFFQKCFGIENIGLTIIALTFLLYLCLLPLTIKQQKYAKLTAAMNPELNAIREKYKNKTDQQSMMKMQQETQMVYDKYGVHPVGSCVQLLIQTPILLAMYRVVNNVPAYVGSVKDIFTDLVNNIMATDGYQKIMESVVADNKLSVLNTDFSLKDHTVVSNYIIDVLYKLPTSGWEALQDKFSGIADLVASTQKNLEHLNNFITLNIGNSPMSIISSSFSNKNYLMLFLAVLVPLVSYLTQVLNIKLMPQQQTQPTGNDQGDAMARQMQMMNKIMPLFSFFMVFTVPVGLGIYWTAGSVCRAIQQVFINRHIRNLNLDVLIEKNQEKAKKKREKMGLAEQQISNAARINTKNLQTNTSVNPKSEKEKEVLLAKADATKSKAAPGSLAAKANMVREFNEHNNK